MMQWIPSPTRALPAVALCLLFVAAGGDVRAGIENQETGEQCWGGDCSHMNDGASPGNGGGSAESSGPANVETYDCTAAETADIESAVEWLSENLSAIDGQMGRNGLMNWPGNSRENFEDKLSKPLKFYCINDKNKCGDGGLKGIVHPVVAQKRINLCAQNIRDDATLRGISRQSRYAHTIAHEIGHLVRINAHRSDCREEFTDPRFSTAIGLAAETAHRGVNYDASEFLGLYCPAPASMPDWQDIIEQKQNQKPPITASKPLG
jgi:hypothetical protein